jgi:hypothetical protein
MYFTASLDYLAYGSWNRGDDQSASASVPYTPPPASMNDYLAAAIQRIIDWFKRIFGI